METCAQHQEIKDDLKELKSRIESCEDCGDSVSGRVSKLEYWRDGNGARGAEERLQGLEEGVKKMADLSITTDQIQEIGRAAAQYVVGSARDRERTFVSKTKAFALIVTPIVTTIGAIIIAVLQMLKAGG